MTGDSKMKTKTALVWRDADGNVVNIGPWDLKIEQVPVANFNADKPKYDKVVTNPVPPGVTKKRESIVAAEDGGRFAKSDHAGLRRAHYPSLADQLDALWKGGDEAEAMRERVAAVKRKFPKPKGA